MDPRPGNLRSAWLWYLAVVVALGQYYFVSSVASEPNSTLYTIIGASSIVAIAVGIVVHRPRSTVGWLLILGAVGAYLAGDYVYASIEETEGFVSFPSTADWLYLAMYPMLIAGIVLVRRAIAPERDPGALAGSIAVGAAVFATVGAIYMNDVLADGTFGTKTRLVASAYPLFDVVLVAVGAWVLLRGRAPQPASWLIGVAIASMVVGNVVFNVAAADFSFESGGVADLGWLAFTSMLGAAALHPSVVDGRAQDVVPVRPIPGGRTVGRTVTLVVAVASIPVAQLVWGDGDDLATTLAALAVAVLCALAAFVSMRRRRRTDTNLHDAARSTSSTSADGGVAIEPAITALVDA